MHLSTHSPNTQLKHTELAPDTKTISCPVKLSGPADKQPVVWKPTFKEFLYAQRQSTKGTASA